MATTNQGNNTTQIQLDALDTPLVTPASKLDADQYSADDLDGVTESLFGSGNMAYASLQASQTDAAMANNSGKYQESEHAPEQNKNDEAIDTDRPLDTGDISGAENFGTAGNFANTTVGSLGASTLSSDIGSFSPDSNLNISGEKFFKNNSSGSASGTSSRSSTSGTANIDSSDRSTTNNQNTNNTTNQNIDNSINLGDDITEIVEETINTVNNEVSEITETISTTINNITETVNNILHETGITETINNVTNVTNEVTETVTNIVNNVLDGEISLDLDLDSLDTIGTNLGVSVEDSIKGNLDIGTTTENLATIASDLTGLNIPSLSLLDTTIGFDLLSGENVDDGNDISIAGLATPDIDLDIIEDIIGDIDISLDAPTELLDGETLVGAVQDTLESIGDLDAADIDEVLNVLGDQNIEGALDAIINNTELGETFDVSVDDVTATAEDIVGGLTEGDTEEIVEAVENVVEDLGDTVDDLTGGATEDLTDTVEDVLDDVADVVDGALGLLGDGDENEDESESGEDDTSWTESTIGEGGLFDDVIDGIGGENDALPDLSGTVSEGLGILDTEPDTGGGLWGGLFG